MWPQPIGCLRQQVTAPKTEMTIIVSPAPDLCPTKYNDKGIKAAEMHDNDAQTDRQEHASRPRGRVWMWDGESPAGGHFFDPTNQVSNDGYRWPRHLNSSPEQAGISSHRSAYMAQTKEPHKDFDKLRWEKAQQGHWVTCIQYTHSRLVCVYKRLLWRLDDRRNGQVEVDVKHAEIDMDGLQELQ